MPQFPSMDSDTEYIQALSGNGVRPSVQRLAIYKYLCENRTHPTADAVYTFLNAQYPTLSRTTVYSTLHTFVQKKLVRSLKIESGEIRYDANTEPHIHFKCSKCGKIYDVFDGGLQDIYEKCAGILPDGFGAEHGEINFWGTCPSCASQVEL